MSEQKPDAASEGGIGQSASTGGLERPGHDALWLWFGLSYAGWLTLPRVMMHEMPDDWQRRMAALLNEWDEAWDLNKLPPMEMTVTMKEGGRFVATPDWLHNYRHPDRKSIAALRYNYASERTAACGRSARLESSTARTTEDE